MSPAYTHTCPVECGSFCEACGALCASCRGSDEECKECDGVGYVSPHTRKADRIKVRVRRQFWRDAQALAEAPGIEDVVTARVGRYAWQRMSATAVIEAAIRIGLKTIDADVYPSVGTE